MYSFSVIIPTLNESNNLAACIGSVRAASTEAEIIVADGKSVDGTQDLARRIGASLVEAPRGRGSQCNTGAIQATGGILLFLHADTCLPPDAFDVLEHVFADQKILLGTFLLQFEPSDWILRCYEFFSGIDSLFTTFGDQCITVRRNFFETLGGFPDWPLFEDVGLLQKARRHTRIHSFPTRVITSSRRYQENGRVRQQLLNLWLMVQYMVGVPPEQLAMRYERNSNQKTANYLDG